MGKWYKSNNIKEHIFCVLSINENRYFFYGFNSTGVYQENDWYSFLDLSFTKGYSLATTEEVEKALIAEAEKKGFKEGVKFVNLKGEVQTVEGQPYIDNDFNIHVTTPREEWYKSNCNSNPFILKNGIWADIIQETEIELTLDQIAEKFGVDKVKIKKD